MATPLSRRRMLGTLAMPCVLPLSDSQDKTAQADSDRTCAQRAATSVNPQSLDRARRADQDLRAGRDRCPLHGIPYALKDIVATRGVRTTNGSRASADWIPAFDATVTERLDAVGAVLLGKPNLWEFPMVGWSFGVVRNPWDLAYSAGGSSSGAGAAVAVRIVPLAIGTGTGSSIRVPAAHCGITGLRPTYGRVSRHGVTPNAWSVDTIGPLANNSLDVALALRAIARRDGKDPTRTADPVPDYAKLPSQELKGVRVGVDRARFFDDAHANVASAALEPIGTLGARIVHVDVPHGEYAPIVRTLHLAEAASFHETRLRDTPQLLGPGVRERLAEAAGYLAVDCVKALCVRSMLVNEAVRVFDRCDVFASPTDPGLAAPFSNPTPRRREPQTPRHRLPVQTPSSPA